MILLSTGFFEGNPNTDAMKTLVTFLAMHNFWQLDDHRLSLCEVTLGVSSIEDSGEAGGDGDTGVETVEHVRTSCGLHSLSQRLYLSSQSRLYPSSNQFFLENLGAAFGAGEKKGKKSMPFFTAIEAVGVLERTTGSPGRTIAFRLTGYTPVALKEAMIFSVVIACRQADENSCMN